MDGTIRRISISALPPPPPDNAGSAPAAARALHFRSGDMDGKSAPGEQAVARPRGEDLAVRLGEVPHPSGQTRARLLAVIATVLVLAFLKWSQVVTMPLAFAVFVIAVMWPLQARLERRLPRWA